MGNDSETMKDSLIWRGQGYMPQENTYREDCSTFPLFHFKDPKEMNIIIKMLSKLFHYKNALAMIFTIEMHWK